MAMVDIPIRDASTVIVLRDAPSAPRVLMGQRGKNAAFMPNKFVFPGGAVDPQDAEVPIASLPSESEMHRLDQHAETGSAKPLLAAAIRELWEETGLTLGKSPAPDGPPPAGWEGFYASGLTPAASDLQFVFRAITPPGRPRRFDARFFVLRAEQLSNDLDDFSQAQDELSHLQWVPVNEARKLNLPFITEVVLAEIGALAKTGQPPSSVPFFNNTSDKSEFFRLS